MDSFHQKYESAFTARYASEEMSYLFSQESKILLFRRLWIALAKAQKALGLSICDTQIAQMEKALPILDFAKFALYEKKFRHDVFAHIHAFGEECPEAKPIIHLGATSCYVTDNADLIQCKTALQMLLSKLAQAIKLLASFAEAQAKTPCLSYTHFQSAQPTTMGKRACLWLQDLFLDAQDWQRIFENFSFLGAKGATGTQSSFLSLFEGDSKKVVAMEALIAKEFGFTNILPIAGQTYTRKIDCNLFHAFASFAASAHKIGTDIRLLAHDGELFESQSPSQVGSSAMPYKRNPIYAERVCGLSRFVISLAQNPAYTLATQWLERSLDDSSNRRICLPEAFLGVDAILNLLIHLFSHLQISSTTCLERLEQEMPAMIMENILMQAVKKGGDRQELHEKLRLLSKEPLKNFVMSVAADLSFGLNQEEIASVSSISALIGRAPEQVSEFLEKDIFPYLSRWKNVNVNHSIVEF